MQDDYQIQIMPVAICYFNYGAHMIILFNIQKKIIVLMKWSYRYPQLDLDIEPRMVSIF